jgi:hypothetical protein
MTTLLTWFEEPREHRPTKRGRWRPSKLRLDATPPVQGDLATGIAEIDDYYVELAKKRMDVGEREKIAA